MEKISIDGRKIGEGESPFIIAEIGLNHNGNVDLAKKLIDIASANGADCVKFQRRTIEQLAITEVLDSKDARFPGFGRTYREIREHHEFNLEIARELKNYCLSRGILYLSTPFDIQAVDFLEQIGVPAFKLASHSLTNIPLINCVASKRKPVLLSTGMCTLEELDRTVDILKRSKVPLLINHCVSTYPTAPESCNLRLISYYRKRYKVPIGYSGHEIGYDITLAAVGLGAVSVERHITIDKTMVGFDHKLSLEPHELYQMCCSIRRIHAALGKENKRLLEEEKITRDKYHVSIVSNILIAKGTRITSSMLTTKNPGTGIPPSRISEVVGRVANEDIPTDVLIKLEMLC